MTALERRWAEQILSAFAPPAGGAGLAPSAGEVDWLGAVALLRRRATFMAALGLRLALWLVALSPLWRLQRFATVSALDPKARSEALAALLNHRSFAVRELTLLLKLSASLALFASDAVRARSGYDRTPVTPIAVRVKRQRAESRMPSSIPPPPATEALTH